MGVWLLIIFVSGSFAFSIWAWRNYDTAPQAEEDRDGASLIIPVVITFLGSFLFEWLRHRTGWPFAIRIGFSAAALVLTQYLAGRLTIRLRPKDENGPEARHNRNPS